MHSNGPLILDQTFNDILHELEYTEHSFFITGKAGTGKSTLLQLFRQTTKKQVVVLAPTGVAALHVRGQTIHSFFAFPPNLMDVRTIKKRPKNQIYKRMELLIIDEISMVRADIIDHMDLFLRI
ncbi:MAG TPA: AAA family ATPase, partial [Saprospiraceae bacterium]|nr:AAA family ATPase [Saprospiraceae bacterium]